MANRKRRKARNSKSKKPVTGPMTDADLEEVRSITRLMKLNLVRAIAICRETGKQILDENRHEFWALAKYVENVQEAIVRLDNKNTTILPSLVEFPERSDDPSQTTWKSLKGMRSRLAHSFERIDHDILWHIVNRQFPVLESLLDVLHFSRVSPEGIRWSFRAGLWRRLPAVTQGGRLDGDNSIPAIIFDERGHAMCVRLGRVADDTIALYSTTPGISLTGIALVDPQGSAQREVLWPHPRSFRPQTRP